MSSIFVTGIDTDAGKTLASVIICKALNMNYWKPVQCGSLEFTDTHFVNKFAPEIKTHLETYCLKEPMSPHAAAFFENASIKLSSFNKPENSSLVIEGAGGLLVPLNDNDTILDLIKHLESSVILVSRNYLGSINHTLLSLEVLRYNKINVLGILFNGEQNQETESIIIKKSGAKHLGRIPLTKEINSEFIEEQAKSLKNTLEKCNEQ